MSGAVRRPAWLLAVPRRSSPWPTPPTHTHTPPLTCMHGSRLQSQACAAPLGYAHTTQCHEHAADTGCECVRARAGLVLAECALSFIPPRPANKHNHYKQLTAAAPASLLHNPPTTTCQRGARSRRLQQPGRGGRGVAMRAWRAHRRHLIRRRTQIARQLHPHLQHALVGRHLQQRRQARAWVRNGTPPPKQPMPQLMPLHSLQALCARGPASTHMPPHPYTLNACATQPLPHTCVAAKLSSMAAYSTRRSAVKRCSSERLAAVIFSYSLPAAPTLSSRRLISTHSSSMRFTCAHVCVSVRGGQRG